MKQANVLHLITQLELGGAQGTTLELLQRLDRSRYSLTLVTSPGGSLEAEARRVPGLTVCTLPSFVRSIRPWKDLRCLIELRRFIRIRRFDIVHTHSSKAGVLGRWAAYWAGAPIICHTVHGFPFHSFQKPWVRLGYRAIERATGHATTDLITVNRADHETALAAQLTRSARHIRIPYGIDLQRFHRNGLSPQAARVQLGLRADAPTIGTIACFKPQKELHDFLMMCAQVRESVPEIQCVVVGDGALRSRLERQRRALGLDETVRFLGWRRDIPEILTALDVFVLTSRWEGLPVAVLEAQAMGVPVVVTDTGGVRDCIENGASGFIVPIGDTESLVDRVATLLRDSHHARVMGERALAQVAERFSVDRMVKAVETMYTDALQAIGHTGA